MGAFLAPGSIPRRRSAIRVGQGASLVVAGIAGREVRRRVGQAQGPPLQIGRAIQNADTVVCMKVCCT